MWYINMAGRRKRWKAFLLLLENEDRDDMSSILIKDTTKEERERIIEESIGNMAMSGRLKETHDRRI